MSRAYVSKEVQPVIRGETFWVLSILSLALLMLLIATLPGMMKSEQPFISETNLLFYALVLYFAGAALYLAYTPQQGSQCKRHFSFSQAALNLTLRKSCQRNEK